VVRVHLRYNLIEKQTAHDFYNEWTSDGFPRFLVVELQHPCPYYDDSYAVNSASMGPWGGESKRLVVGSPWSQLASKSQRF
jgi:hypothetical protein